MSFLCSSLLSLSYHLYVRPFESKVEDRLNIINEAIMLFVVYLVTCVAVYQDSSTDIGAIIVKFIWASWIINGLMVVYLVITEVYRKLRGIYLRRKMAKKSLKIPKSPPKSTKSTKPTEG